MYANLPLSTPRVVSVVRFSAFAIPKSQTLIEPSWLINTFDGDTSRWMIDNGLPSRSRFSCA